MRKAIWIFILGIAFNSMAITGFTYKWNPVSGDTVTRDKLKWNYDSIRNWSNRAADSINKCPRWSSMLYQKDSTWRYMHIDTIVGCDTIYAKKAKIQKATIDTITDLDSIYSDQAKFKNAWIENDSSSHITINETDSTQYPYIYLRIANVNNKKIPRIMFHNNGLIFSNASGDIPLKFKKDSLWIKGDLYDTGMVACSNVLTNYTQYGTAAASKDSVYIDTTFACSLYCNTSFLQTGTGHIIQSGNKITFTVPTLAGTMNGTNFPDIRGIPSKFKPLQSHFSTCLIESNSNYAEGLFYYSVASHDYKIYELNSGSLSPLVTGTGGIYCTTITWIK